MENEKIRIIPLGGLGEVGRNMILLEYEKSILIVDIGLGFPDENMHGIDFTIPNISYLKGKEKNILGAIFTHGHYDHIGAVPYIMPKIGSIPIYAGELTKGIILKRQDDFTNQPKLEIKTIKQDSKINLGPFEISPFRLNHSIPDNFGLLIKTPIGNIVHTSDFKFDESPVNELPVDFSKLKEIGNKGILLLMSESTGAEEEGHSLSEKTIFENLDKIFQKTKGRIIVGSFASLINRIQQSITLSERYNRKVAIEGYSLKTNIEICETLGKIKIKKGTIINTKDIGKYPDSKITILCTGAQGEENASFMKIASKEHKFIHIRNKDTIIFSSSVIPGNERSVQSLKDEFYRQGAKVFHYKMMDIHTGGHARQDELKQMINIMKPKFFVPIYGQYSMLVKHAELAEEQGIKKENIIIAENGEIIDLAKDKISKENKKIPISCVMVDGLGVGDVGEVVLKDRQNLAEDGMFVIVAIIDKKTGKVKGSPDIISRGFIYLRESKQLLRETRQKTIKIVNNLTGSDHAVNWTFVKKELRSKIGHFLYSKTKRRPIVLPVIIEV